MWDYHAYQRGIILDEGLNKEIMVVDNISTSVIMTLLSWLTYLTNSSSGRLSSGMGGAVGGGGA